MLASSSVYILVQPTSYVIAYGILHRYEQKEIVSTTDRTPGIEAAPCRCTYCIYIYNYIYILSNKLKTHMRGLAHTYSALPPFPFATWIKDVVLAAQWCYHSKLPWPRPFQHPGPTDLGLETHTKWVPVQWQRLRKMLWFRIGAKRITRIDRNTVGIALFLGVLSSVHCIDFEWHCD
jgi:hypothetical protein